ncbi:PEP-CTERM sorting domain-containing protein [Methyloversatilis thermotolerans]|uniref:PEP-CTERM sorting domain-containing protein n=1 Tax=Methyloversatilis thermotolerans TaxID=1346290 RepID=UPI00035D7805|nr:PEP-CTERM sorting domain-containing protein [Methyloversatilis thermotolerans]
MIRRFTRCALPLLALAAVGSARAESCGDTSFAGLAASACFGSFANNINGASSETSYLASVLGGTWTVVGSSDSSGFGPFSSQPAGSTGVTLDFDSALSGRFVIGIKAANQYSYYYFEASTPVTSLSVDSTAGIALNKKGIAQDVSHVVLYSGGALAPVPEPAGWALFAAGLGVMAVIARRRT